MSYGAGKYDDAATTARAMAQAQGVLLVVIKGDKGSGFSVQAPIEVLHAIPELLEDIAKQIRADRDSFVRRHAS